MTSVFECKVSKPDFRRAARSMAVIDERLKALHERRTRVEEELRLFYPSIRNRNSLFQEFDKLMKWGAANMFYVVAEPESVCPHELSACRDLLIRSGDKLQVVIKPTLLQCGEPERLFLLHRICLAATRVVNQEPGIAWTDIQPASRA